MLAAIRPSDWEWLLFFHVLIAIVFFGVYVTATLLTVVGAARTDPGTRRLANMLVLFVGIPAIVASEFIGSELATREKVDKENWNEIAHVLLIASLALTILFLILNWRRSRTRWMALFPGAIVAILLVLAYTMSAKPGA